MRSTTSSTSAPPNSDMETNPIEFTLLAQGNFVVLTLKSPRLGYGELDSWGKQLDEVVDAHPGQVIVLDLSDVMALSSIAIGKIFRARNLAMGTDGTIRIVARSKAVLDVFKACQLSRIIDIYYDLESALK